MIAKFNSAKETVREELERGSLAWLSNPVVSNAKNLVVVELAFSPGADALHKHPDQEEMRCVIEDRSSSGSIKKAPLGRGTPFSLELTRCTHPSISAPGTRSCWRSWVRASGRRGTNWWMRPIRNHAPTTIPSSRPVDTNPTAAGPPPSSQSFQKHVVVEQRQIQRVVAGNQWLRTGLWREAFGTPSGPGSESTGPQRLSDPGRQRLGRLRTTHHCRRR